MQCVRDAFDKNIEKYFFSICFNYKYIIKLYNNIIHKKIELGML